MTFPVPPGVSCDHEGLTPGRTERTDLVLRRCKTARNIPSLLTSSCGFLYCFSFKHISKERADGETYRASSSSTLKLCGSLQTSVLLPVNPTGGAQSALHVWGTPGVPLRRLSRWVGDKRFSELAPVSVRSRCPDEHLPVIHGSSVIAGNQNKLVA